MRARSVYAPCRGHAFCEAYHRRYHPANCFMASVYLHFLSDAFEKYPSSHGRKPEIFEDHAPHARSTSSAKKQMEIPQNAYLP